MYWKKKQKTKNSIHEQGARCHFPWMGVEVGGISSHGDIARQLVHLIPCSLPDSVVPSLFCSGSRRSFNGAATPSYGRLSCAKSLQSCPTLCDSPDCRSSSAHGISQARVLQWIAIPFSRGIFPIQGSNPCLLLARKFPYWLSHQGRPH